MRARILDPQVKLYSSPEPNALSLATLEQGAEIEFGAVIKKSGKKWVEVLMPTGQKGYIPAETKVFHLRMAAPLQNNVKIYHDATEHSLVLNTLKRGSKVLLVEVVRRDGRDWVKVREPNGVEGYISGQTRLRVTPPKTKALARKNMISGVLWCIGGIIVTTATMSAASEGGTYIIAWGAILFGAVQFIQGVYQYFTATS
jgi:hypothetical protein